MNNHKWNSFLKDVFVCSLGAYGGPEAHIGVFIDQLVTKKKHLTEEELIELVALCSILPGPTSTQTIVAVGHKVGGPMLGFLTMLVWSLPVLTLMTILSFLYQFLDLLNISTDSLRYIGPLAVGFIVVAAFKIGRKVVTNRLTAILMIFGAVTTYFIRSPWIFPMVLLIGGAISVLASGERNVWNHVKLSPPWRYLAAFAGIALGSVILTLTWDNILVHLFESFYRYGYLVFGGGQVVVPVMYSEMVDIRQYMNNQEFLTGYGLVQGLPGPMFSFSAYVGGMAARNYGTFTQVMAAVLSGIGIFLPGLLLIYFVYPVWERLRQIRGIKIALKGINAIAGGMIAVAAVIVMQKSGFQLDNLLVSAVTIVLLLTKKVPAPIIVLLALVAGFVR
ncbi:chromate efflux transporter [Acidaminobacter sp.]|uniref:chromate efflux transporter n=1 Tax=Acidaminobacter sp. TaxID=1872102 RepID=UPI00138444C0|nr:chromate efflux transporter [Acidaminobacter sp.]MDK9711370.1 chromate efflux transporter [Acidaminobacter sp.]MZQ96577.1 chromate efflux transporter [Acidaminobacter sp.]